MSSTTGAFQMSMVRVPQCPACDCSDAQLVDVVEDSFLKDMRSERLTGSVENRLVRCTDCNLIRLDPRASDESLAAIYTEWYSVGYSTSQAGLGDDTARGNEFRSGHLRRLHHVTRAPGKLLDVGTGSGVFLSIAQEAGWDVSGLDFSVDAARLASKHHNARVHVGTLRDVPATEYDVITMFDYLEHTTTTRQDVAAARDLLKPGGYLVIRVPNIDGWQARLMGKKWVGIISLHLVYFDTPSLTKLLINEGFSVVSHDRGNYQSLWRLIANKLSWIWHRASSEPQLSATAHPPNVASETSMRERIWRFAVASVFEFVDHCGGWFGRSNYIFVIAKKSI